MEADGTLLIKNIDRAAEGTYVCLAENSVGKDSDYYEVIVKGKKIFGINVFRKPHKELINKFRTLWNREVWHVHIFFLDLLTVVPSKTLYVKEGETIDIKCDIPHTATDQLRWFKVISIIQVTFNNLSSVTSIYFCVYRTEKSG